MQRRLTLALVGLTLLAVVLVGAGVLAFAQIGARQDTKDQVARELEAFVDLGGTIPSLEDLGPVIRRLSQAFEITDFHIVTVAENGLVSSTRRDPGRSDPGIPLTQFVLTPEQLATISAGQLVSIDQGRSVLGMQALDVDDQIVTRRGFQIAVLIKRDIAPIPDQARRWFLISATLVLVTSVLVATLLARRFVAPIRAIEDATTKLASGDLTARIEVSGDDEVADLGRSVNQMAADLERSRQLEQQFLLSVSHDLRTPLTSISGYAEALVDNAIDDPVQAGAIIQNHANRLNRLVTDLLDLAKLNSRQFRVETRTVDALDVVSRSVDGLIPAAAGHGLSLTMSGESGLTIQVDPDRLAQILGNLVENAIKYADQSIEVVVGRVGSDRVEISVSDDGPGIAVDDLPHIFERLYVTQRRPRREESSSGLGLAIVHELTQAMGGTVDAHQVQSGGTAMVLHFPLVPGSARP